MAREMKDSGVNMVGKIPYNWEMKPIKAIASYNDETLNEATDECFEFDYIDIGSVQYGKGITQYQRMKFRDAPSRARRLVRRNDIIVSTVRTYLKAVAKIDYNDLPQVASTGFVVVRAKETLPLFLYYALLSEAFICAVESHSTGISYPAINASDVVKLKIPIPPVDEQGRISAFLDSKCAEIDAVLEKTRASIEEYKNLKQVIITQAVTKGIRGDRPMKESGIGGIDSIPYDWSVQKFSYLATVKCNIVSPQEYLDYPQVSPESIEKGSGKLHSCKTVRDSGVISGNHLFFEGQILYSKIRPKLNKVCIAPFSGLCSADMYPIETEQNTKFIVYYMRSDAFLNQVSMITEDRVKMPKINQNELGAILVAVPPEQSEQAEIVKYLNQRCAEIDELIRKKEQLAFEIDAYKKSLIFEYVTGKKEVGNVDRI